MDESGNAWPVPEGMTPDQMDVVRRIAGSVPLVIVPAHEPDDDLDEDAGADYGLVNHDGDPFRDALALIRAEFADDGEAVEAMMANLACPLHTMEVLAVLVCRALDEHGLDVLGRLADWQAEFEAGL
jgi:hypothetical protein